MTRRRLLGLVALGALLLGGCHVDAVASTRMLPNGTGTVEAIVVLDADAVKAAEAGGAKLENRIVISDLGQAGWEVVPWTRRPDGSATISARKAFRNPGEVGPIYTELSGPNGPFKSIHAGMRDGFVTKQWDFDGMLDLAAPNAGVASDQQLAQKITGQGFDPAKVQELLSGAIGSSITVKNRVELPNASVKEWVGIVGRPVSMRTASSRMDTRRTAFIVGGAVLTGLGLLLFFVGEAIGRRKRRGGSRGRR